MDNILEVGIDLVLYLQGLGEWLLAPMYIFTFLGNEEFFLFIMPILYWSINAKLGLRIGLLLLTTAALNGIVKLMGQAPRPYWYNPEVRAFTTEPSFGLPSGHAMNATSVWGGMAATLRRTWAWAAAVILIFFIGLSRIYLGVHFPTDVLAGWLLGGLVLVIFLKLEAPISIWFQHLPFLTKIVTSFFYSFSLLLLGVVVRWSLSAWVIPEDWLSNTAASSELEEVLDPLSITGLVSNAGVLFGLLVGVVLLSQWGGYEARGLLWKRITRFPIGLVGVIILWQGLGMIQPGGEDLVDNLFRYIRYALVGLWIAGLAPALFIYLGLATKKSTNNETISTRR